MMAIVSQPIARIAIRYIVGTVLGAQVASTALADPDIMTLVYAGTAALIGLATELWYRWARVSGGDT
jgi:predicted branched-subunit amino acid permease